MSILNSNTIENSECSPRKSLFAHSQTGLLEMFRDATHLKVNLNLQNRYVIPIFVFSARMASPMGDMGSGSGKGGGSGGSIRDAGGAMGKLEAGREEEYFHKLVCCSAV